MAWGAFPVEPDLLARAVGWLSTSLSPFQYQLFTRSALCCELSKVPSLFRFFHLFKLTVSHDFRTESGFRWRGSSGQHLMSMYPFLSLLGKDTCSAKSLLCSSPCEGPALDLVDSSGGSRLSPYHAYRADSLSLKTRRILSRGIFSGILLIIRMPVAVRRSAC